MPLLEKELNEKGYFSYPQLMSDILTKHFNDKGVKPELPQAPKVIKEA
ncbi:unnamed protein product [marine sediment metagenome]|uniref:Uncharacterized protein n=1 Tax=marine sediment metagenome TaxID=412755 RepID=X1RC00_9ZZZZ